MEGETLGVFACRCPELRLVDPMVWKGADSDLGVIVKEFAVKFYAILMSCTEDDAFQIWYSVKDGNRLEAMRFLMKRYEPRTPGTKRALLKAVINNVPAKKLEEIEKNPMNVGRAHEEIRGLGRRALARRLVGDCNHRHVHQRFQGALGVDHPRDEVQRDPKRDHELRVKEKGFVRHSAQSHGG